MGEPRHVPVFHALHGLREVLVVVVRLDEPLAQLVGRETLVDGPLKLPAELARTPAEVRLEDLTDVHAARHAEWVQHDVDRRAVLEERHVLFGQDAADDALVTVPSGHLVADLQLALDGDVHLHHLDDAGRELVAATQALDLVA